MIGNRLRSVMDNLIPEQVRRAGFGLVARALPVGLRAPRSRLDASTRAIVIASLEGELDCLVNDAASRALTLRSAEELLLTADVLAWLRGGDIPGRGSVDFLEDRVALMNGAMHLSEIELRDAYLAALEELVRSTQGAIAAGRWAHRDLNDEAALGRRLRWFGQKLDAMRCSRGLSIGELADRADMDVLNVVAYLVGTLEPGYGALAAFGTALSADPEQLFPPESPSPHGWVDDLVIGDLPETGEPPRKRDDPSEETGGRP